MPDPDGFRPARWLPGPHLQTIVPTLLPARRTPATAQRRIVEVGPDCAVGLDVDAPRGRRGTLVLVHGMCGSAESGYVRRTARIALERGWSVARMNLRNCGGTERLCRTLYNAGQSGDLARVLEAVETDGMCRPLCAAGFSLGGNIVLRYAGLSGADCRADAMVAVNPPIDLERCARAIELPSNRLYQAYYTRSLCAQLRRIARVRPVPGPPARPGRVGTVRRFDALYTAPDAGYGSAEEYYAAASAAPTLGGLRRPALLLSAADDPFVPVDVFRPHRGLRGLHLVHPGAGGHCGYWQRRPPRYWAGAALVDFLEQAVGAA